MPKTAPKSNKSRKNLRATKARNKFLMIAVAAALIGALLVGMVLVSRSQDIRNQAATPQRHMLNPRCSSITRFVPAGTPGSHECYMMQGNNPNVKMHYCPTWAVYKEKKCIGQGRG